MMKVALYITGAGFISMASIVYSGFGFTTGVTAYYITGFILIITAVIITIKDRNKNVKESYPVCHSCKATNNANYKFCSTCGTKMLTFRQS